MKTKIISAFPGTGKSHFHRNNPTISIDSDSSLFSWIYINNEKVRNPEFPSNYIKHIKENINKTNYIFVSSHKEVRQALHEANLDFYLVYPNINQLELYISKYENRGSPKEFINLVKNNWNNWISELQEETNCTLIELHNTTITDIINSLDD